MHGRVVMCMFVLANPSCSLASTIIWQWLTSLLHWAWQHLAADALYMPGFAASSLICCSDILQHALLCCTCCCRLMPSAPGRVCSVPLCH